MLLRKRLPALLAAGMAAALVLSACGSADDNGADTGQTETTDGSGVSEESPDSDDDEAEDTKSGAPTEMIVATFAGALGETIADIAKDFEAENNVKITWEEGSGVQSVAKIAAAADNQIYDVAIVPGQSQVQASVNGYLEPIDHDVVNLDNVYPELLAPGDDGAPLGMIVTDLYYNTEAFEDNGWEPPTSMKDLLDEKYCNQVGILDVTQTYGLYTVLGLGELTQEQAEAGELDAAFDNGLEQLAAAKNCLPSVESSGGALEQKMQTGQYVIGTHGSVRILPLVEAGAPLQAVTPEEGAYLTLSFVAPVKNAPNPELAQKLIDWYLSEDAQEQLMRKTFYGPVVDTVQVPDDLVEMGVPNRDVIDQLMIPERLTVTDNRDAWIDAFQRAMS